MENDTEDKVISVKNVSIFSRMRSEQSKRNTSGTNIFLKDRPTEIWLRVNIKASSG